MSNRTARMIEALEFTRAIRQGVVGDIVCEPSVMGDTVLKKLASDPAFRPSVEEEKQAAANLGYGPEALRLAARLTGKTAAGVLREASAPEKTAAEKLRERILGIEKTAVKFDVLIRALRGAKGTAAYGPLKNFVREAAAKQGIIFDDIAHAVKNPGTGAAKSLRRVEAGRVPREIAEAHPVSGLRGARVRDNLEGARRAERARRAEQGRGARTERAEGTRARGAAEPAATRAAGAGAGVGPGGLTAQNEAALFAFAKKNPVLRNMGRIEDISAAVSANRHLQRAFRDFTTRWGYGGRAFAPSGDAARAAFAQRTLDRAAVASRAAREGGRAAAPPVIAAQGPIRRAAARLTRGRVGKPATTVTPAGQQLQTVDEFGNVGWRQPARPGGRAGADVASGRRTTQPPAQQAAGGGAAPAAGGGTAPAPGGGTQPATSFTNKPVSEWNVGNIGQWARQNWVPLAAGAGAGVIGSGALRRN